MADRRITDLAKKLYRREIGRRDFIRQAAALGAVLVLYFGLAGALSFALPVAAVAGALLSIALVVVVAGRKASLTKAARNIKVRSASAPGRHSMADRETPRRDKSFESPYWGWSGCSRKRPHPASSSV